MGKEQSIQNRIRVAFSKAGSVMFRINTGRAWTGNKIIRMPATHPTWPRAVVILDPRPFKTGTPAGYADLTGWHPVEITPEMVGQTVAVYMAAEVKTPKGRATDRQNNFLGTVLAAGGIAGILRHEDTVSPLIDGYKKRLSRKD